MRIVFMGSSGFALPTLEAISVARGFEVISVYTAPPKPSGRGLKVKVTPLHELALKLGLPVQTPLSLKGHEVEECDVIVLVAYGKLLPIHVLEVPRHGCINLHPSLLPRWRGAAPIQNTLLAGDGETGVSIIKMNERLDEGDILFQSRMDITKEDNVDTLQHKLAISGAKSMVEVIIEIDSITPSKQPEEGVTYANKIVKRPLDPSRPIQEIIGYIKAMRGGNITLHNNRSIKIIDADYNLEIHSHTPGKILNKSMHISCTGGVLIPKLVQLPGKRVTEISEFLRGKPEFTNH